MKYILHRSNANDDNATLVELCFNNGDFVEKGDLLMVFETSKAAIEIEAVESGPIQYLVDVGNVVNVDETIALQNEAPIDVDVNQKTGNTIFSKKAMQLISDHKIDEAIFSGKQFVSEADVLSEIKEAPQESVQQRSPLEGYSEPPVAYFQFKMQGKDALQQLFKLIEEHLLKLIGIDVAHVLVNHNNKIVPYRLDFTLETPQKTLGKAFMEVYRGKKSAEQVFLCVSHLTSKFNFSHSALLYPGSLITIASAENTESSEVTVNITYDHRKLDGHTILKEVEKLI